VLNLYRAALRARRDIDGASALDWLDAGRPDVLAFRRGNLVCVTVFDGPPYAVPAEWGSAVLRSDAATGSVLAAGTSAWFRP
jgi:alpha-glucosidase